MKIVASFVLFAWGSLAAACELIPPAVAGDEVKPPHVYAAKIERWVDGDTFDTTVELGFYVLLKMRFRLAGIDTPERWQPGADEATAAAERLTQGVVLLKTYKPDKYGRWLADVILPGCVNLSTWMIERGLGVPYSGGKRSSTGKK